MDLTEVEGLADLINAETEAQRRQALRQMEGELGRLYDGWRDRLVRLLAHVEAEIDFPDEDLPSGILTAIAPKVSELCDEIGDHLNDSRRGERLRDGFRVVILGEPNVGKSSLLNLLARREVAIVSEEAGTTRDILEAHLDLDGLPVTVLDTAGLREHAGQVEQEGMRRAVAQAEMADLRVLLADIRDYPEPGELIDHLKDGDLLVWSKVDLIAPEGSSGSSGGQTDDGELRISTTSGEGINRLLSVRTPRAAAQICVAEAPSITRARHRDGLERVVEHLESLSCGGSTAVDSEVELIAEELRLAARGLGRLTGRIDVEDMLDVIFKDFCIGK
jgi:tRNA modification GTPase